MRSGAVAVSIGQAIQDLALTGIPNYDSHIRQFNEFLRSTGSSVSAQAIERFWIHLKTLNYAPATLNAKRTALKSGIKKTFGQVPDALRFIQAIDGFFKSNLRSFKIDRSVKSREILKSAELETMIAETPEKISVIIETLALTGLRISELLSLDTRRMTIRQKFAYFRVVGKGRKEREIILSWDLLKRIQQTFGSKKLLFTNRQKSPLSRQYVHSEIKKHSQRIIGRPIWPHQLRHYFATQKIISEGKSVKAVSRYLGHSGVDITLEMYVHDSLTPDDLF